MNVLGNIKCKGSADGMLSLIIIIIYMGCDAGEYNVSKKTRYSANGIHILSVQEVRKPSRCAGIKQVSIMHKDAPRKGLIGNWIAKSESMHLIGRICIWKATGSCQGVEAAKHLSPFLEAWWRSLSFNKEIYHMQHLIWSVIYHSSGAIINEYGSFNCSGACHKETILWERDSLRTTWENISIQLRCTLLETVWVSPNNLHAFHLYFPSQAKNGHAAICIRELHL